MLRPGSLLRPGPTKVGPYIRGEEPTKAGPYIRGEEPTKVGPYIRGEEPTKVGPYIRGEEPTKVGPYIRGEEPTKVGLYIRGEDNMITRRQFGKLTLAGLAIAGRTGGRVLHAAGASSTINGVHLGVQTYSFRDLPRPAGAADSVDVIIKAMTEAGLTECELFSPQIEPQFSAGARGQRGAPPSPEAIKAREDLRKWRLETPIDHFRAVGKKFDAAGITVHAFCHNMNAGFTDAEIDRGFQVAKALGARVMTTSTTLDVARRIAPIADKHKMNIGMHGHSNVTDPNEFATPDSFAAAMKLSKYLKVNLDVGHFVSADFDPIAYIKAHHADITNLHIKDRKKHQGDNTPWGEGDTPIREVLQLLKKERWPIPAYIEYEYRGAGTPVEEVKKCYAFAKQALA